MELRQNDPPDFVEKLTASTTTSIWSGCRSLPRTSPGVTTPWPAVTTGATVHCSSLGPGELASSPLQVLRNRCHRSLSGFLCRLPSPPEERGILLDTLLHQLPCMFLHDIRFQTPCHAFLHTCESLRIQRPNPDETHPRHRGRGVHHGGHC